MNRGDADGVRACFLPDAITTRYDGSTVTVGGVAETARTAPEDPVTRTRQHHLTLFLVDPDEQGRGDHRAVRTYFILTEVREPPTIAIHSSCYTDDVVRLVDGEWLFASRQIQHTWPKPPPA
jgi:SnoaL-like protein